MQPKEHRTIYQQKQDVGSIMVRTNDNRIEPATKALSGIYELFFPNDASVQNQLASGLRDFEIFFDTIMLFVPTYVFFAKINYDYATAGIAGDVTNINYIPLSAADAIIKFGGTWLHEEDKTVTVCTLVSCVDGKIFPVLYQLDLNTSELIYLYDGVTDGNQLSTLNITSFEEPVFTYNKFRNLFDISVVVKSPDFLNNIFGIVQYNIQLAAGQCTLLSTNVITPNTSPTPF